MIDRPYRIGAYRQSQKDIDTLIMRFKELQKDLTINSPEHSHLGIAIRSLSTAADHAAMANRLRK